MIPATLRFCKNSLFFCLLLVLSSGFTTENEAVKSDPITNEVRIERNKPVPMRDGVILYADVYRPA